LQALAALHGLWIVLLAPGVIWAGRTWPPARLRLLGLALVLTSCLAVAVLLGLDLPVWLGSVPPEDQRFLWRRAVYLVATHTDLPFVQVCLAGTACWVAGIRRGRKQRVLLDAWPADSQVT
jgi:hypothetical protein